MAAANSYTIFAVKHGSTVLPVTESSVNYGANVMLRGHSGLLDMTQAFMMSQSPVISFSTPDVGAALGLCGISGLAIATGSTFIAYMQKMKDQGARDTTGHELKTVGEGLMVPTRISVGTDSVASASFDVHAISTGATAPVVDSSAALGTLAINNVLYVAGSVAVNGTTIANTGFDIDFGLEITKVRHSGNVWDSGVSVMARSAKITIKSIDVAALRTLTQAVAVTSLTAYLRKVGRGTPARVADATAEHVKFSATSGLGTTGTIGGSHGQIINGDLVVDLLWDGTNAALAIDTASAIS